MTEVTLPLWAAIPVAGLLLIAAFLVLVGGLGQLRLPYFYQRIHSSALINTFGAGCVLLASMLFFTVARQRPVLHEIVITLAILLTVPVATMVLASAAVARDRRNRREMPMPPEDRERIAERQQRN